MSISDRIVQLGSKPHEFIYHAYFHVLDQNNAWVNHKLIPKAIIYTIVTCHSCPNQKGLILTKVAHFSQKLTTYKKWRSFGVFETFSSFSFLKNFGEAASSLHTWNAQCPNCGNMNPKNKNKNKKWKKYLKRRKRKYILNRWRTWDSQHACIFTTQQQQP